METATKGAWYVLMLSEIPGEMIKARSGFVTGLQFSSGEFHVSAIGQKRWQICTADFRIHQIQYTNAFLSAELD